MISKVEESSTKEPVMSLQLSLAKSAQEIIDAGY